MKQLDPRIARALENSLRKMMVAGYADHNSEHRDPAHIQHALETEMAHLTELLGTPVFRPGGTDAEFREFLAELDATRSKRRQRWQ